MPEIQLENSHQIDPASFDVRLHPALALQTYEYFGTDPNRQQAKVDFSSGDSYHLQMSYPKLETAALDALEISLQDRRRVSGYVFGEDSLTTSSIDNRLEEVNFLRLAYALNAGAGQTETSAEQIASEFVKTTETLYGKPDQELVDSILGTVRRRYGSDDPEIQKLWEELESGFEVVLNDGSVVCVPAVTFPSNHVEIPALSAPARDMLRKEWVLFDGILVEAQSLLSDIIAAKMNLNEDYTTQEINFGGRDLAKLFKLGAVGLAEVLATKPFTVKIDENGSVASWDSGSQAVIVGANRLSSLGAWKKVRGTVAHEATHGLKSVNGLNSGEPALASGVFTKDDQGRWVSYLDYEEGNNKLGEMLLMHNGLDQEGVSETVEHDYLYTVIAGLVYRGMDDRQVAEIAKKLLLIEKRFLDPSLEPKAADKAIADTITGKIERLFRGTNTASGVLVGGHMPLFTKDLAYLSGALQAIQFWNARAEEAVQTANPQKFIHNVFNIQNQGKINPLDDRQYAAAQRAYENNQKQQVL